MGATPTTAYDISLQVFGGSLDDFGRWMALGETLSHLEHLVHQGLAAKAPEDTCVRYERV
jgi:hypothetical protein